MITLDHIYVSGKYIHGTLKFITGTMQSEIRLTEAEINEVRELAYRFINDRRNVLREELNGYAGPALLAAPTSVTLSNDVPF